MTEAFCLGTAQDRENARDRSWDVFWVSDRVNDLALSGTAVEINFSVSEFYEYRKARLVFQTIAELEAFAEANGLMHDISVAPDLGRWFEVDMFFDDRVVEVRAVSWEGVVDVR